MSPPARTRAPGSERTERLCTDSEDPMPDERAAILDRFNYHAPTDKQHDLLDEAHRRIMACAEFLVDELPNSRDRAVALTSLEDTRMKINKAIIFSDGG